MKVVWTRMVGVIDFMYEAICIVYMKIYFVCDEEILLVKKIVPEAIK